MSITIKDVAKKVGVTPTTVSMVMRNDPRISEETRQKVLQAVKELNYYPSRSAKGLVTKRTGNIGFVLTDDHFLRTEPFYTKIFLGTEFIARNTDYYVLLSTIDRNYEQNPVIPRFILEKSIDGIIIAGKVPQKFLDDISEYDIPKVFVDYYPDTGEHNVVLIDNQRGGYIATKHLIELGHRRIAFIGGDIKHPSISDRLVGYKQALEYFGIEIDPQLIITDEDYPARQNGYSAAKKLLSNCSDFTAVFACNDAMAIGFMQYCSENNIKIPDDISLIGFDDVEADLLLNPPLTTMRVPKDDLGMEAMNLIVNLLSSPHSSQIKKILVPVELIKRESTKGPKK